VKPTVLVVDDHPLWRQTVVSLIERAELAGAIFEAADGHEAIAEARTRRPDLVVMDIALPGTDGIAATKAIVEGGHARVMVLSSSDDEDQVLDAVRAGATGYLLKTSGAPEIVEALRRVLAGELVFPPSLTAIVLDELRGRRRSPRGPLASLSSREIDVLALMAEGKTNERIGRTLHLSPKTVETHVTSIFTKLGLDPSAGGHRRVLAVITYLRSARTRVNPEDDAG
jgi:DNA-binding NarL/FixJ family response regulator